MKKSDLRPGQYLDNAVQVVCCPDPRVKGLFLRLHSMFGISDLVPIPGTENWEEGDGKTEPTWAESLSQMGTIQ